MKFNFPLRAQTQSAHKAADAERLGGTGHKAAAWTGRRVRGENGERGRVLCGHGNQNGCKVEEQIDDSQG